MTEQTQARDLFQAAYENRYTWDNRFPGYTADVEIKRGDQTCTGKVRVNADLSYEVLEISDESQKESLQSQLWETVTHRKRSSFAESHGKHSFDLGETDDTGAVEILVGGDAMGSNYKVRDREICQVSRVFPGQVAFTINHKDSLDTGEGYISTHYDVIYRKPDSGELVRENEVKLTYEKMGGYYLMTHQVVHSNEQGQRSVAETSVSNIQLLQPAAV
ncbi:DUF3386 domain-containing protein [Oculatella sp. LEGE 06141]|uniref:DUF3386 domain-containing protein n=1 Tax=Oculatella sp. LEGE 06141 TaxID=1828648 RepID=UPI001882A9CB|nr:DUF3386 domain-containing protein [Oculatella sp. LEGE 06141]MBE9181765.1 DUF3386 domain-containing protein [Oculatella sp. LEGE 06141]